MTRQRCPHESLRRSLVKRYVAGLMVILFSRLQAPKWPAATRSLVSKACASLRTVVTSSSHDRKQHGGGEANCVCCWVVVSSLLRICGNCWLRDGGYNTTNKDGEWHEAENLQKPRRRLAGVEVSAQDIPGCDECHFVNRQKIQLKRRQLKSRWLASVRHRWQTHDSCANFVWEASVDQQAPKNKTDFRRSTPGQSVRIEVVETDLERFELLVNTREEHK